MGVARAVLLFYLACISSLSPVSSEDVYCVTPEHGEPCDCSGVTNDCQTLDYYFSATEDYFTPGVTFRFMSGDHYSHHTLTRSGLANLQFVRDKVQDEDSTKVITARDGEYTWFTANNSRNISFYGLIFVFDCPLNSICYQYAFQFSNVSEVVFENTTFSSNYSGYVSMSYGRDITISNASITTNNITSVSISNTTGSVIIKHCNFTGREALDSTSVVIQDTNYNFNCSLDNEIVISNSRFNHTNGVHMIFNDASGCLNIFIEQTVFSKAQKGGLEFVSTSSSSTSATWLLILKLDSDVFDGNYDIGATLNIIVFNQLYICNCTFRNNLNTALEIYFENNPNSSVYVEDSLFFSNIIPSLTTNVPATALLIQNNNGCTEKGLEIFVLRNVTFHNNGQTQLGIGDLEKPITLICLQELILINCSFVNNSGTPLRAISSSFVVVGDLYFTGNTATEGGAVYLYGGSKMVLNDTASVHFTNNHALSTGGAVQISDNNLYPPFSGPVCFIAVEDDSEVIMIFSNNTAGNGGDAIYGGSLDQALASNGSCIELTKEVSDFNLSQQQQQQRNNLSLISSTPSRVCLCESQQPQCLQFSKHISVFPGETIGLHAFTVGQDFGTSKGTVYAQFLDANISLSALQRSQKVTQYDCKLNVLLYTMNSTQENSTNILVLTASDINVNDYYDIETIDRAVEEYYRSGNTTIPQVLLQIPVFVIVMFKRCPAGFKLEDQSCKCIDQLNELPGVSCYIGSVPKIQREKTLWINASENTFQYSENCLATHCTTSTIEVKQNSPDEQCIDNHSGPLCGRCKKNFSLAIGSSRCLSDCSDKYLSFLVLFAGAGVLMVAIIKYLDLTVTHGGLNGLIFYANIIQTSNTAFLASNQTGVGNRLFAVLIAWLNLDFGIETCFSSGLDMYTKTWLQFVFPFYIWGLVLVIILMCRYSHKATRFFGNNTVQVLCTLFILSYNKILRTITVVLSLAEVKHIDVLTGHQITQIVWSYDGELQSKHIALLAFSSAVLIFLWVPFTTFLILGPWLQRWNHRRGLKWVARMTPLLDAFYSPHKDRHRYWVGVLLLARVVVIIPAAIPSSDTSATVLTVALLSASLLFYTSSVAGVYKKKYLSLLEDSFLANLIAFSALSFYSDSSKVIAGYISFAHVSLILLIIVGVQLYRKLEGKSCNRPACCTNVRFIEPTNAEASSSHRAGYSDLDEDQSREIINNTENSS